MSTKINLKSSQASTTRKQVEKINLKSSQASANRKQVEKFIPYNNLEKPLLKDERYKYNPYHPPEYFTYQNLQSMFYDELLKKAAIKLQDKAREIAEEIAGKIKKIEGEKNNLADYNIEIVKNAFNEIIESKINGSIQNLIPKNKEDQELLRVKLWNILYTLNFGYDIRKPKYKKKKSTGGMNPGDDDYGFIIEEWNRNSPRISPKSISSSPPSRKSSPFPLEEPPDPDPDPYPHIGIVTLSRYFIFPWKKLLGIVYKSLCNIFKPQPPIRKSARYEPNLFDRQPLLNYWTNDLINNKREAIKKVLLKSYRDKKAIKEKAIKLFDDIDKTYELREAVNNSILARLLIDEEIKGFDVVRGNDVIERKMMFKNYWEQLWRDNNRYTYNPVDYMDIYSPGSIRKVRGEYTTIFSISFIEIFSRVSLLSQFFALLQTFKNLNVFVNLHDCETIGLYDDEDMEIYQKCNIYDRFAMRDMFFIADKVLSDLKIIDNSNRKFITIKNLQSMKAGDLYTWYQIYKIPKPGKKYNLGIYHNIQMDQSATIILFLLLRDAPKRTSISWDIRKKHDNLSRENVICGLKNFYFGYENIGLLLKFLNEIFNNATTWPDWDTYIHTDEEFEKYWLIHKNPDMGNEREKTLRKIREYKKKDRCEYNKEGKYFFQEIFAMKYIWQVKLLRQRLNRIFYFLAKKHNISNFYLYTSNFTYDLQHDHLNINNYYLDELFSIPIKVRIEWGKINENDWEKHQRWVDGIFEITELQNQKAS